MEPAVASRPREDLGHMARHMMQIMDKLLKSGFSPGGRTPDWTPAVDITELEDRYEIIVELAQEHQIPLWNFWLAIQPLPRHGLQLDLEHLTWATTDLDNPQIMQCAWPWRNLTALQALEAVWKAVRSQP